MKELLATLALAKEQAEMLAMRDDVKNGKKLECVTPSREELVLKFMLALAANPSWHDPGLIHALAEELVDAYLTNVLKLPEIESVKS